MKLAKVVAVRPGNKADLLFLDDGRRVPGVRVMCSMASSSSGQFGLAAPDAQKEADPYTAPARSDRDLVACVGFYGATPVVLGFLFPEVSELIFKDQDRYMNRTASDFYTTVDGKGNAEAFHPSGAYVRMGAGSAHEDLRGADINGAFDPKRNADQKVHIHVEQAGGVASIDIDPEGVITIRTGKSFTLQAGEGGTIKASDLLFDADSSRFTGAVRIDKALDVGETIDAQGDVKGDGVSLSEHVHKGVKPGTPAELSGKPVKS